MKRRAFVKTAATALPAFAVLGISPASSARPAPEIEPIMLPEPEKDGGKSVLASLQDRMTCRDIGYSRHS
jgi:hypothetical protein